MADPRIRTLFIKTGVVKRLTKEKLLYEHEAEKQKEKTDSYKEQGILTRINKNINQTSSNY